MKIKVLQKNDIRNDVLQNQKRKAVYIHIKNPQKKKRDFKTLFAHSKNK
jgi:hypothetical protein